MKEVFIFKGLDDFIKSATLVDHFLVFNSYRNSILIKLDNLDYFPTPPDDDLPKTYRLVLRRGIQHENLSYKPLTLILHERLLLCEIVAPFLFFFNKKINNKMVLSLSFLTCF